MKSSGRLPDSYPFFLLLLIVAAFGALIPWLGFYWDDWPSIWFLHFMGPDGFSQVFASDRPLLGGLFQLTTPLLGEHPLAWQVFGLLARWIAALSFWRLVRQAAPEWPRLADVSAALFAVYPGFSQQFISVTYSHVFILQTVFFLSLNWMVQAASGKPPAWLRTLLALLSGAAAMFSVEYFFGLELLRPLLIWNARRERITRDRLLRTFLAWLPYLAVGAGFLFWRVALSNTPRGDVTLLEDLAVQPSATVFDLLARNVLPDIFESGALAWVQALGSGLPFLAVSLAAGAAVSAGAWLWLRRSDRQTNAVSNIRSGLVVMMLGGFALLAGGWPFWATNLPIELRFPWDRFTLAMMPGASLGAAGFTLLLTRWPRVKTFVFHLLLTLAVAAQLQSANDFRRDWNLMKDFFWQLAWRAPAIEPGTLLITSELPFSYFSDNSLTAPINWMYSPDSIDNPMPFALSDLDTRFGRRIQSFKPGQDYKQNYRAFTFRGSTSQAVVFSYTPPGCLKVLVAGRDERLPQQPRFLSDAMRLSRVELVIVDAPNPARPPAHILGDEPAAGWCTYFEKAELAVQGNNWAEAARLGDLASSLNERLYEVQAPELLPYIEAYAHTLRWEQALDLTRQALQLSPRLKRSLCDTWSRISTETADSSARQASLLKLADILTCE